MTDATDNKAKFDQTFPPLPETRRTSQMVNDMLTQTDARNAKKDEVAAAMATVSGQITALQSAVNGKSDASTINPQITSIQSQLSTIATALSTKQSTITPSAYISPAATNAPANAPTNAGILAGVLGSDLNATNAKQNDLATKYNDLATRFNTLISQLITQGLKLPS